MTKSSFSLFELILIIILISIIAVFIKIKEPINKLDLATNRLALYLKEVRYKALIDDKYNKNNPLWHKQRWTLKFFRCSSSVGGIYYSIYSDENKTGHPSADESLKDPLTKKAIFSTNKCESNNKYSKYVLLSKEYGIKNIEMSCNTTSSLGQLSFGIDGRVYTKLSPYDEEHYTYELTNSCKIKLLDENKKTKIIEIIPKTGYVRVIN